MNAQEYFTELQCLQTHPELHVLLKDHVKLLIDCLGYAFEEIDELRVRIATLEKKEVS